MTRPNEGPMAGVGFDPTSATVWSNFLTTNPGGWGGGGRNSSVGSVLGSLPCLMQRRGFDTPWENVSGRGDFSLGVDMGSDSNPPKLFRIRKNTEV